MATIETDSLTKRYESVLAGSDLDLRVERGKIFGFLGPNGVGKSTTSNMVRNFVRPSSGEGSVLGSDPQTRQCLQLAAEGSVT